MAQNPNQISVAAGQLPSILHRHCDGPAGDPKQILAHCRLGLNIFYSTTESQDNSSTESELLIKLGVVFFGLVVNSTLHYGISTYDKTPYHTSALTGEMWVLELLNGHPKRICSALGVHKHVFWQIIKDLRQSGHQDSKIITLEE